MRQILFLVGPTAVGKTKVSIYLARLLNTHIISCDSMQVYKGMDIGTQKPTASQLRSVPHHMVSMISPARNFSVGDFRQKAIGYIDQIEKQGKIPLLVGGTALYMKALIDGLFPSPPADRRLRKRLLMLQKQNKPGFLYKQLKKIDSKTAALLHPNDTRRIIRALEVYEKTGKPMSELKKKTKGLSARYEVKIFCLNRDREQLYRMIDERVDKMFGQGLLKECRRLRKRRLSMTALQALGYKEVFSYLDTGLSLQKAKALIKQYTRNFAKRQLSWFRNDERI